MSLFSRLRSILRGALTPGIPPFTADRGPARLLVLRHAEKTGDKDDPHLSAQGQQRAQSLARFVPKQFGKPDFLIAASESKRSNRPYETLVPLAEACGLEIIDNFHDEDVEDVVDMLANEAPFAGKFGVVCWRHSDLSRLITALGAPDGTYPDPWEQTRFDLLIDIAYVGTAPPHVRQVTPPF